MTDSIKEKIHETFEKYGVSSKDMAIAVISFKGLTWTTYFGTLALCYRYKPLKRLSKIPTIKSKLEYAETNYPIYGKTKNWIIDKSQKLGKSRFFEPIPRTMGLKSKRFATAFTENIIISKLLLPITLPLQFWIIVSYFKNRKNKSTQTSETITKD